MAVNISPKRTLYSALALQKGPLNRVLPQSNLLRASDCVHFMGGPGVSNTSPPPSPPKPLPPHIQGHIFSSGSLQQNVGRFPFLDAMELLTHSFHIPWHQQWSYFEYQKTIPPNGQTILLWENSGKEGKEINVIGYGRLLPLEPPVFVGETQIRPYRTAKVTDIAIHPKAQGKGLSRWLLESLIQKAYEEGFETIALEVHRDNPIALGLYHRLGFQIKPHAAIHNGGHVWMERSTGKVTLPQTPLPSVPEPKSKTRRSPWRPPNRDAMLHNKHPWIIQCLRIWAHVMEFMTQWAKKSNHSSPLGDPSGSPSSGIQNPLSESALNPVFLPELYTLFSIQRQ